MATSSAFLLQPCSSFSPTLSFFHHANRNIYLNSLIPSAKKLTFSLKQPLYISYALTESDSPKPLDTTPFAVLQELADCFALPPDYFSQLPQDLRLDLNDAAFDLSNGPVIDECDRELGEILLNLSRAWEVADTSTSAALASRLPSLEGTLTSNAKSALGKCLIAAGRRYQSMGQYGQGELQKIAKAMISAGKLLSAQTSTETEETAPLNATRMFKFGELQVAFTTDKAYIGAGIALVFGILSWELSQGIQSAPESSLQYANDNALLLAKSLRGALLATCYSSTVLSTFSCVGLVLLGRQLAAEGDEKEKKK